MSKNRFTSKYHSLLVSGAVILVLIVPFVSMTVSASSSGGSSGIFEQPWDPEDLPASAVGISSSSATSFSTGERTGTAGSGEGTSVIITESRGNLKEDQSATHMVVFERDGTLSVSCLSGTGIEVFSQKGGGWPANNTTRSDYGASDLVTVSTPLILDITAGTWYFTLFPLGDHGSYDLTARQVGESSSGSGSTPSSSFSSSSGFSSFSMG